MAAISTFFYILMLISFFLLLIGLLSPSLSLFWFNGEKNRKVSSKYYGLFFIVFAIISGVTQTKEQQEAVEKRNIEYEQKKQQKKEQEALEIKKLEEEAQKAAEEKIVKVGETLHTGYFDITVNNFNVRNSVMTGDSYSSLQPENGNLYLIINATFKNTDTESRMITDGSVWINYNGKNYEYDQSEQILSEGWGLFLDQINPLLSKTTNLVYKISSELKGEVYWQPGRAASDQKIFLGKL